MLFSNLRRSAFMAGIGIGLLLNLMLVPVARAAFDPPGGDGGGAPDPMPVPEWGEDEYIAANTEVYEWLFWGREWDGTSTMSVEGPVLEEGRNDGFNNYDDFFVLEALVVDRLTSTEAAASLSSEELDDWVDGHVEVCFFTGLIVVEAGVSKAVAGFTYSSDAIFDAQVAIVQVFDETIEARFFDFWYFKSQQGEITSGSPDWSWWLCNPPGSEFPDADCEAIIADCLAEFESNMRIAVAAYKAVLATAGVSCIVGGILLGSFCLVGNLLACGLFGWMSTRCAAILGGATAALGTALIAARIALDDCLGDCDLNQYGCP